MSNVDTRIAGVYIKPKNRSAFTKQIVWAIIRFFLSYLLHEGHQSFPVLSAVLVNSRLLSADNAHPSIILQGRLLCLELRRKLKQEEP